MIPPYSLNKWAAQTMHDNKYNNKYNNSDNSAFHWSHRKNNNYCKRMKTTICFAATATKYFLSVHEMNGSYGWYIWLCLMVANKRKWLQGENYCERRSDRRKTQRKNDEEKIQRNICIFSKIWTFSQDFTPLFISHGIFDLIVIRAVDLIATSAFFLPSSKLLSL